MVAQARRPRAARLRRSGERCRSERRQTRAGDGRCGPVARRWSQQNGWRMGFVELGSGRQDGSAAAASRFAPGSLPVPKRGHRRGGKPWRSAAMRAGRPPRWAWAVPGWEAGAGEAAPMGRRRLGNRRSAGGNPALRAPSGSGRLRLAGSRDGRARSVKERDKERFI